MIIPRLQYQRLKTAIQPGEVTVLYGPRRVGKTTLLEELVKEIKEPFIKFSGDNSLDQKNLSFHDERNLKAIVGNNKLVIVDEAQRIENIGLSLKIIVDTMPDVSVIASGSASLDLARKTEEPLTGRKKTIILYPISFEEIKGFMNKYEAEVQLERWLIWGGYPKVVLTNDVKTRSDYLGELIGSYLYKDLLELEEVKRSVKIIDLLRLLAFQIGQEVSLSELGANLGMNHETVSRYLDLLEQVFVIFNVRGFSRNLRKEIVKNSRYYFWDNGVRNALINNFNNLNLRSDLGQLWENFLTVERLKKIANHGGRINYYFWRTYDKKEIDWIEESGGEIKGYEFKWKGEMKKSTVAEFQSAYHGSELFTITKDNYLGFIS